MNPFIVGQIGPDSKFKGAQIQYPLMIGLDMIMASVVLFLNK